MIQQLRLLLLRMGPLWEVHADTRRNSNRRPFRVVGAVDDLGGVKSGGSRVIFTPRGVCLQRISKLLVIACE